MGSLKNQWLVNQRQRQAAADPGSFRPTQPGDPDFSISATPSSQAQFPAAAAEKRLYEGRVYAENRLAESRQLGYDTTNPAFDPLNEVAETGFLERALTLGETLIGWIDGPRQAANLLLEDISGGVAEEGMRDPNIGDYFDTFFGGITDAEGFEAQTGINPMSGSTTLDMWGWPEADSWWERGLRGAAHFALDVAIDPLTYVTFGLSGLGKRVAAAVGETFADDAVRWVLPKLRAGTLTEAASALPEGNYLRTLSRGLDDTVAQFKEEFGHKLVPNMAVAEGKGNTQALFATLEDQLRYASDDAEAVIELAIRQKVGKDVLQPLVARDFGEIDKAAQEFLPKYALGGMRISVPFVKGMSPAHLFDDAGQATVGRLGTLQRGWVVPGTQGLGRKMVGNPVREIAKKLRGSSTKAEGLADILEQANNMMDIDNGILRALRNGTIEPWQYQVTRASLNTIGELVHREQIAGQMNRHLDEIQTLVEDDPILEVDDVFAQIYDTLDQVNPDDEILRSLDAHLPGAVVTPTTTAIDTKVKAVAEDVRDVMDTHIRVLADLNPKVEAQYLADRTPQVLAPAMRQLVYRLARGGGIGDLSTPGRQILAMFMDAVSKGGKLEANIGGAGVVRTMYGGEASRLAAVTLIDDGMIMFDNETLRTIGARARQSLRGGEVDPSAVTEARLSVTEMNELLGPEVKALAEKRGITLPKDWDGKVLNENPLEVTLEFVDNTQRAIQGWRFLNALKAIGLAEEASAGLDVHRILNALHTRIVSESEELISPVGVPTVGTVSAPAGWLKRMTTSFNGALSQTDKDMFIDIPGGKKGANFEEAVQDAAENGIREPVVVQIDPEGWAVIGDGNHRMRLAAEVGDEMEVPVKYERVAELHPENQRLINVSRTLLDDAPTEGLHNAADLFKVYPWQPQAMKNTKSVLKGTSTMYNTIPLGVMNELDAAGFPYGDSEVLGLRRLYNFVRTSTPASFLERRKHATPGKNDEMWPLLEGVLRNKTGPKSAWQRGDVANWIYFDKKGKPAMILNVGGDAEHPIDIAWGSSPTIGKEAKKAIRGMTDVLDEEFRSGSLKGKLTYDNVMKMMDNEIISDHGARGLFRYLRHKTAGLGDATKEWLDGQAGEVVQTQMWFDEWQEGVQDMFDMYAMLRTAKGTTVIDSSKLQLIGDDAFAQKLLALTKIGNQLSEAGHQTVANIMRGLDEMMVDAPVREGFVNPQLFGMGGQALDGLTVQKDMANWMRQLTQNANVAYTPAGIGALKTATHDVLRWWRAMATIARPSFHIRNLVGGVWNNMIIGVGPEDYKLVSTSGRQMRNFLREGDDIETAISKLAPEVQPYYKAAWEHNVLSGFSTTEFRKILLKEQRDKWSWAKVWDVDDFVLTRMGAHFMESTEDFLRMSAFMRWYDPTDPSTARIAKEMVEAVHFNYTRLTPFETKVKSLIPFFVWQRRNIPLQISQLVENPRMIQRYNHMMQAMNENFGGNEQGLPAGDNFTAFAAGTGYYVNEDTPFWGRVMIDPDLPVRDLVDLPWPDLPGLIEFANQLAGPHISTLVDINKEAEFGDINAPAPLNAVLRSLAAAGLYDTTLDGDVRIPYWQRTVMETVFPFSREVIDPLTGGPSDPNRQQRSGVAPDDNPLEASLKNLGFTLARGVGLKLNTPVDVRASAARQEQELQAAIRRMRMQGIAAPSQDA